MPHHLPRENHLMANATCTCGASWPGATARAHCSGCHRTFSAYTSFDQHRLEGRCQDPATRSLVYDEKAQVWRSPGRAPEGTWGAQ